jgi:hypothetical protein
MSGDPTYQRERRSFVTRRADRDGAGPDDRGELMLSLRVLSLNVFGDGVRDALDPRAKVRLER